MKITHSLVLGFFLLGGMNSATAATLSISGLVDTINGFDGQPIADDSKVQVGYFLGISPDKEPSSYVKADWATFTTLLETVTGNAFIGGIIPIEGGIDLTGTRVNSETDFMGLPARIGIRIFDSESGRFNTFSLDGELAQIEEPNDLNPNSGGADLTTEGSKVFWEDNANPFQTSLAIPEPSSALTLLLGAGLLLGRRRRG